MPHFTILCSGCLFPRQKEEKRAKETEGKVYNPQIWWRQTYLEVQDEGSYSFLIYWLSVKSLTLRALNKTINSIGNHFLSAAWTVLNINFFVIAVRHVSELAGLVLWLIINAGGSWKEQHLTVRYFSEASTFRTQKLFFTGTCIDFLDSATISQQYYLESRAWYSLDVKEAIKVCFILS